LVGLLNDHAKGLALILPPAWDALSAEDEYRSKRLAAVLAVFAGVERVLLLGDLQLEAGRLGFNGKTPHELSAPMARLDGFNFPAGRFREASDELKALVHSLESSPLVWRLAVGVIALGAPAGVVASIVQDATSQAIAALMEMLVERVKRLSHLHIAVRQMLAVRGAISAAALQQLTGLSNDNLPLLTHCLGYDEPVRVSLLVRTALANALENSTPDTHHKLAQHYKLLDGVNNPNQIQTSSQMHAWLERVHHLGHAGAEGASEWSTLELPAPEFYWDRARFLSREQRDYGAAAALYEACLQRFPHDNYALHYGAWNRWKNKENSPAVAARFKQAVEQAQGNPWWSQRYLASLIDLGRYSEARSAWKQSLGHIDPDGSKAMAGPWLVENFHLPVAKAWLRAGCWHDALRTLGALRTRFGIAALKELVAQIESVRDEERRLAFAWLKKHPGPQWSSAANVLTALQNQHSMLASPALTEGEGGSASLTWSQDEVVVTVELSRDGKAYWFAMERKNATEAVDGEWEPNTPCPKQLDAWLARLSHA
jgi:tetratricopeptide (TPR) repeat protein